jgi:hypothetical protein
MKKLSEMTQIELAAFVQTHLENHGIHVVLSGGAAVSYFCDNRYTSADVDLVNMYGVRRQRIQEAMEEIGFIESGRYFGHNDSPFIIEFPPGPLTVGVEPVQEIRDIELSTGTLRIISPTDSVKDRLAAYYHWGDEQCLYQAILIRDSVEVDLGEIERWSKGEGKEEEYNSFLEGTAE